MKKMIQPLIRLAAACVAGALTAPLAKGQTSIVNQIDAGMFQNYHTNLFINAGQNRGFTKKLNPLIDRLPAAQHDLARDYIYTRLTALGLSTRLDPFSFATDFGGPAYLYKSCNNIIATLPGTNPDADCFIVGANYDSLDRGQPNPINFSLGAAPRSPGADMNASGVAALLCLADVLGKQSFQSTIVFVAFDASQKNYAGSDRYVKRFTTANSNKVNRIFRDDIRCMVSLDTIAYNRKKGGYADTALLYGGNSFPTRNRRKLGNAMAAFGGLTVIQGGTIQNSDHLPFTLAGIDAIALMEGGVWKNPFIYTAYDSADQTNYIDYAYAADMTRGVAGFLCQQAELITP
ncbi:MAG: M28 family peptidase [Kiritimatiellia bacterium]